jgi:hypothetical protein
MGGAGGNPFCNQFNCMNGCCAGNVCINNISAQQCGKGGVMCQPCGMCQICSAAGTCDVDPSSQWDITAVSAMLTAVDPNDMPPDTAWDLPGELYGNSLPDPICQFEMPVGTALGVVGPIYDTLSPMWNGKINGANPVAARDLLAGGKNWQIWVGDLDSPTKAEIACQINAPMDPAAFKAGMLTQTNNRGCVSVTIKLTCH